MQCEIEDAKTANSPIKLAALMMALSIEFVLKSHWETIVI